MKQSNSPGGDSETGGTSDIWQRDVIEKLVMASVTEQRRARRWGIFFKSLFFGYLLLILGFGFMGEWNGESIKGNDHTALVEIEGLIASADMGVDADRVIKSLKAAYKDKNTKGVIIRINSPGGSPVQSADINAEIGRLKEKHPDIPLYAVVSDVCASGGYYIAVAADAIYANPSSIVGSIGVRMDQFGFVDALEKLGVERRLLTAGDHKGAMDPFLPVAEEDRDHIQDLLDQIHEQFIDAVKQGRGDRLVMSSDLFSGRFWTGTEGMSLGLVDGFGDMRHVAREVIGEKKIVDFTVEEDVWERLAGRLGAGVGTALAKMLGIGGNAGIR